MKLLIVDDQPETYERFRADLHRESPEIVIDAATNAVDAFDRFQPAGYDLVILDQVMGDPGQNGTDFLRRLREQPAARLPAILFVTRHYNGLPITEILTIGVPVSLFLEKDDSFEAMLLVAVQLMLRRIGAAVRYDPKDLFGDELIALILREAGEIITREHDGYLTLDQQRQIGTLVRSYIAGLSMQSAWEVDDVLELSIFFAQSLCKVFDLPDNLVEVLRRFLNIEEILYTVPHYRDHFFHQIKVFLLGFCVLNALNRQGALRGTQLAGSDGVKIWFMASAFHDIGYPFEKMAGWLDLFVEGVLRSPGDPGRGQRVIPVEFRWGSLLGRPFHSYHLGRIVDHVCKCYGKCQDTAAALAAELTDFVVGRPDHGLFSSLIVQNFARIKVDDAQVDPVAAAIALHNDDVSGAVRRVVGKLTFERDPLSFLLAYCDLAQDWGRVRPVGMSRSGYGAFGYPVFAGGSLFDPGDLAARRAPSVGIVLRYPRAMSVAEQATWRTEIFARFIEPACDRWAVGDGGTVSLRFSIAYEMGGPGHPLLERLVF